MMETIFKAFRLMRENVGGIFKTIGYFLLIGIAVFVFTLLGAIFFPLLLLLIPIGYFTQIFTVKTYECLFLRRTEDLHLKEVISESFDSFKANGWRLFGFNLARICLSILLVIVLTISIFGGFVLLMLTLFLTLCFGYFSQYVNTAIALGQPNAFHNGFRYWKSILICALIAGGFSFIPLLGSLVMIVFNFILPLKIILDVKANLNETLSYQTGSIYQ